MIYGGPYGRPNLGPTCALLGPDLGPTWVQLGPYLDPTWAQLGSHLGPTWAQLGPYLGPTWAQLGPNLLPDGPTDFPSELTSRRRPNSRRTHYILKAIDQMPA